MIRIKRGVNIKTLKPQIVLGLQVVNEVYLRHSVKECWITSADDSKHSRQTLHDFGYACDIRIWNIPEGINRINMVKEIKKYLGKQFDVVLEEDHIHLEFDPRN